MYDSILTDYPRLNGEKSDAPRIQRAIDNTYNGILSIPKGDYYIDSPILITNRCSLKMHSAARLIATEEMEFVVTYDGLANYHALSIFNDDGSIYDNLGIFIEGGDIDGNGMASCLKITNAHHYTLTNTALHNGKDYGLYVGSADGHLYELICNNVYCKCTMKGLSGNIGIYSAKSDCHYNDCIVVDYTTGMKIDGFANRLTRCHIWSGTVAPENMDMQTWSDLYAERKKKHNLKLYDYATLVEKYNNEIPEMLKNSVAFHIKGGYNVLDGCYADTAEIGYLIEHDTRLISCDFFNNGLMGLKNSTAIKHIKGKLQIMASTFRGPVGTEKLYEGDGKDVEWISNTCIGGELLNPPKEFEK